MTDLTAITTPFGLLDKETQDALLAHGGPYEWWDGEEWLELDYPGWGGENTYRVKPQPTKPREWWIVTEVKTGRRWVHDTPDHTPALGSTSTHACVRVREVLE